MSAKLAILDYGMGNRRSVEKAFAHVGARPSITRDEAQIRAADGIVLPGVGAFPRAMANLVELGMDELVRELAHDGVPILGVCLGMQLLFASSAEHEVTPGLGLLPGAVRMLQTDGRRLPHIGWNTVALRPGARITAGLGPEAAFYHVHTYACHPERDEDCAGRSEYGETFCSIVERDNVFGAQFHPEKSSHDGLTLLRTFAALCHHRAPA